MGQSKTRILVIIVFFFIVSFVIAVLLTNLGKETRINVILENHTKTLQTYYEVLQHNQRITADIAYKETINNKAFMNILKKANSAKNNNNKQLINKYRKEAYNLLEEKYQLLKEQGILQYHFVFPDNKVFLRMHKPSKFGDNLTHIRTDFNYTNSTLKSTHGFAQGRTAHAFRNVYPIINENDEHLGAVEVSFSSELLQRYFTNVNKIHTHFLVNKDIFKSKAWNRNDLILRYLPSAENPNFMITMTDDHTKEKCIIENGKRIETIKESIIEQMKEDKSFSVYTLYQGKARVVSFFPIKHNITKESIAWIVSYRMDPLIDQTLESYEYIYVALFIVLLFVFIFIYFLLNQKNILNTLVNEKTAILTKVNEELQKKEHELEKLNHNLEDRIEQEVAQNRSKDKVLYEQTKMAALGEMIGNIAHQWRQPLSVISTGVTGMLMQKRMGTLDDTKFEKTCVTINDNAQYLSKTIDDFRNFIQGNSKKELFNLKESIESFLSLVNSSIKKESIMVKIDIADDIEVQGMRNELNQCLINLFNNAKDAIILQNTKLIFISAYRDKDKLAIVFKDNGGGIDNSIIDKIFEPYFTTKHQSQGTGLGLNMTYRLIVEGMKGTIEVRNEKYFFEDQEYIGARFEIKIPKY
jgi:signal transduction histidine kinase